MRLFLVGGGGPGGYFLDLLWHFLGRQTPGLPSTGAQQAL